MKLVAAHILKQKEKDKTPIFVCATHDVTSFGYLERKPIKEICAFLTRTLMGQLAPGARQVITHENKWQVVCLKFEDGLGCFAVTSMDYPSRVTFQMLGKVATMFRRTIPVRRWERSVKDYELNNDFHEELKGLLSQYKNPAKFDAITSTDAKVNAAKDEVRKTMEQVFDNMEQLDSLLEKSKDVSKQTEDMYKKSKKMNKGCCGVM
eukprot:GHVH01006280.1.p1 GENE.GHVH01006280.1~~GHVH01006280.1.p1  ORF type:complete len:207 (-),score=33.56 GHVH01006280.1:83-703(-)